MTTTEKIAWRKLSLWWLAPYPTSVDRAFTGPNHLLIDCPGPRGRIRSGTSTKSSRRSPTLRWAFLLRVNPVGQKLQFKASRCWGRAWV